MNLNTAENASTGYSPFQIMFNHKPNTALSNLWDIQYLILTQASLEQIKENLSIAINIIKKNIAKHMRRLNINIQEADILSNCVK